MQKLPEASDRKNRRRMRKENGTSRQKDEAHSISGSDRQGNNTLLTGTIYQPLRSGRIWHKVNF